jgi:tetratricopeptide (TPR) repeat protein
VSIKRVLITSVLIVCLTGCLSVTGRIFPTTNEVYNLKTNFKQYVDSKYKNRSAEEIVFSFQDAVDSAINVLETEERGSVAYAQAELIFYLLASSQEGKLLDSSIFSGEIISALEKIDLEKEDPWFQASVYILLGDSHANKGRFIVASNYYRKVMGSETYSVEYKVLAVTSYINSSGRFFSNLDEMPRFRVFLNSIVKYIIILQDEQPENSKITYLLAETYSQLGMSDAACEHAFAALEMGLSNIDKKATQFIVNTDCGQENIDGNSEKEGKGIV